MKKKFSFLALLMMVPLFLLGCGKNDTSNDEKLKVAVSINPLKEFTEKIGGDKVDVYTVVKDNMEPHDFEFTPSDLKEITSRKVFIYNGLGLEDWLTQIEENAGDTTLVDSSKGVDVITDNGAKDPHVWLSLKEAKVQCENIKNALVEADSKNKDYYEKNYKDYIEKLDELYNEYKPKFDELKNRDFVTSHEAFGYLCREYNLKQEPINGLFNEEGETTFKDMGELVNYCKENNITTIFSENTESQKSAETLSKEIGAKIVPIYTLETAPGDMSYLEAMKYDYDKIIESLK